MKFHPYHESFEMLFNILLIVLYAVSLTLKFINLFFDHNFFTTFDFCILHNYFCYRTLPYGLLLFRFRVSPSFCFSYIQLTIRRYCYFSESFLLYSLIIFCCCLLALFDNGRFSSEQKYN